MAAGAGKRRDVPIRRVDVGAEELRIEACAIDCRPGVEEQVPAEVGAGRVSGEGEGAGRDLGTRPHPARTRAQLSRGYPTSVRAAGCLDPPGCGRSRTPTLVDRVLPCLDVEEMRHRSVGVERAGNPLTSVDPRERVERRLVDGQPELHRLGRDRAESFVMVCQPVCAGFSMSSLQM